MDKRILEQICDLLLIYQNPRALGDMSDQTIEKRQAEGKYTGVNDRDESTC